MRTVATKLQFLILLPFLMLEELYFIPWYKVGVYWCAMHALILRVNSEQLSFTHDGGCRSVQAEDQKIKL